MGGKKEWVKACKINLFFFIIIIISSIQRQCSKWGRRIESFLLDLKVSENLESGDFFFLSSVSQANVHVKAFVQYVYIFRILYKFKYFNKQTH